MLCAVKKIFPLEKNPGTWSLAYRTGLAMQITWPRWTLPYCNWTGAASRNWCSSWPGPIRTKATVWGA